MDNDIAIKLENITKIYKLYDSPLDRLKESLHPFRKKFHKDFYALNDVSFNIRKGETIGVVGKNGSGKSTLLKIITGVLTPSSGNVVVNGKLSALLELGAGFNPELTGIENVYFSGTLMGYTREEMDQRLESILSFAEIGDFVYQPVKTYSSGMFIRLAFSVAINIEPELLILDEVLAVGDTPFQNKCLNVIHHLVESENTTILFVAHDINAMRLMCDRCVLLDRGKMVLDDLPAKVIDYYTRSFSTIPVPDPSDNVMVTLYSSEHIKATDVICGGAYYLLLAIDDLFIENGLMLAFSFVNLENKFSYRFETDKFRDIKGDVVNRLIRVDFKELNLPRGNYTIRVAISDGNYLNRKHQVDEAVLFNVKDDFTNPKFLIADWSEEVDEKLKIGLLGWWGGRNEGDDYILSVLQQAFNKDFRVVPIEVPFELNALDSLNQLDFLIIGGGGLFTVTPPYPFDTFDIWRTKLRTPFGFFGVGVQEVLPHYRRVFSQIVESSSFFIVRDQGSFDVVMPYCNDVIKAPDLTFLAPRRLDCERKREPSVIGVNLRIWNFDTARTYDNAAWCDAINALPGDKETIPFSFLSGLEDTDAMRNIHGKRNVEFSLSHYSRVEVMIGMRLHSLIFAAQNKIPIIGISYAPKVRRFFEELGLEEFCLEPTEYGRLRQVYEDVLARYDEISAKLSDYTHDATKEISEIAEFVRNTIKKTSSSAIASR